MEFVGAFTVVHPLGYTDDRTVGVPGALPLLTVLSATAALGTREPDIVDSEQSGCKRTCTRMRRAWCRLSGVVFSTTCNHLSVCATVLCWCCVVRVCRSERYGLHVEGLAICKSALSRRFARNLGVLRTILSLLLAVSLGRKRYDCFVLGSITRMEF